jgi:glycosyltransferase involved in cell wall biosynthesis
MRFLVSIKRSKMKKLLYITPRIDGSGGLQHVFSIKTNYLQKHYGYDVTIVTTNAKSAQNFFDFSKIKQINKKLGGWGPFYLTNYVRLVKSEIKIKKPDVLIIVDNGLKGLLLPYFLRKCKVKMVFEQHGFRFYEDVEQKLHLFQRLKNAVLNRIINYSISFVDEMVVLTQASTNEWKVKNIQIIPNPLWIENPKSNTLEAKVAITVGRQEFVKGYDLLLPIWKRVIQKYPDWKLHIYSDYNPALKLNELAQELNLQNNVVFHEPTLEIEKVYATASIYLMTSRHEGFGMVLLEAMACELPCVAFDCPTGPAELIQNNFNGYLIQPFDLNTYAEKVIHLIADSELRRKLGENGQHSSQKYQLSAVMEKWHQLFCGL